MNTIDIKKTTTQTESDNIAV